METKEFKVNIPDGYAIDEKNSTFECIKFKPINKSKFSEYNGKYHIGGYYIHGSDIMPFNINMKSECYNCQGNKNVFATEKQAKSALAMAQISQIMVNDERFGGVITDDEWKNTNMFKCVITRRENKIRSYDYDVSVEYHFLAFRTDIQRDLFLKENEQLVKDYLMID